MPWVVRDGCVEHQSIGQQQFFFLKHNWKLLGLKNKPGKTLSPLCKFGLHLQLHHPVQVLFPEKTKSVVFNPSQIHFIELGFCNQLCNRSEFPKY